MSSEIVVYAVQSSPLWWPQPRQDSWPGRYGSASSKGADMSSRFIYEGFYCWYEQGGLYNL